MVGMASFSRSRRLTERSSERSENACDVAARTREARDDAGVHRIAAEQEHHRNRYGCQSPSPESGAAGDDEVDLCTQQFVGERGEFAVMAFHDTAS
jgi:hypothetical protein